MTDYYVNVLNAAGVKQAVLTDFQSLSYTRRVNAPGLLQIGLRGDHPILAGLADRWQFEVMRRPDGQAAFDRDFVGYYRQGEYYYGDQGSKDVITCPGMMRLLGGRIVAWKAGTANRSEFTGVAAETIMKTLVSYNAGAQATAANGRIREGAISGMTVEADGAGGNAKDWTCPFENLLETLQKLAVIAGGDFDLVKTAAATWQFRFYAGQLGTDRTAGVVFALERGNMANPIYKMMRMDERTAAIVGGKGEGSARGVAVRTGTGYSTANDEEVFVNATDIEADDSAGLNDRGDAALAERAAKETFEFDVIQTPVSRYGVHYFLGDLATAVNPRTGASLAVKIEEATITLDASGKETISIGLKV